MLERYWGGDHQDGRADVCRAHILPQIHQKRISMWDSADRKPTEPQQDFRLLKGREKSPRNWAGQEKTPEREKSAKAPHWQGSRPGRSGAPVPLGREPLLLCLSHIDRGPHPRGQPHTPSLSLASAVGGAQLELRLWRTGLVGAEVAVWIACWAPESAFSPLTLSNRHLFTGCMHQAQAPGQAAPTAGRTAGIHTHRPSPQKP